ncbi:molybdopterin oxidoreductase family protein [Parerythrobacter jejuensis]|uniref:Molybdopterin-dependent oxidoreductase n=1 Tax=Parerythrobacter jejuensis TaxID=795812 RepID=A0A845ATH3_9SPHN|nr:molybdopterin oxidoreductase family protein [Parerythrobacter jejuensis]MXP32315.1 molybdopterin-dependent oxidoreductase [Parerythrobacter jejuensis]
MTTIHHRTCHICEANCGVLVEMDGREVVSIKGNPDHVLSRGHICPKATAIADLQDDPDRLRRPMKRTAEGWQELDWDTAFREIAAKVAELEGQQARSAFYRGNPGAHDYALSTQSGYLQRAVGARGTFSASTLDQIPHHYAQFQMYGHVSLAAVPDIDRSQLIVIVGGNPVASNGSLWTVPDFRKRVKEMQARGGRLVVVDPRKTETARIADAWHPVRPGTDTALFIGILQCVLAQGDTLRPGLAELVDGSWAKVKPMVDTFDLDDLAQHCGMPADTIRALAAELASGKSSAIYGRMGVSVCEFGAVNQWLIQLINLATGNLDREGGTMFPQPLLDLVGQVGRGSLRTVETARGTLPSVMSEIPTVAFADELTRDDEQRIRTLFVIAGNPVLSAPDGRRTEDALAGLDLMVSMDMHITETSRHAHYILPPCGPLEKDHFTFFFGPLAVRDFGAYSPATLEMEEGAKADWEIASELAQAILSAKGKQVPNLPTPREQLDAMLQASPAGMTLAEVEAQPNGVDLGPLKPCLAERLLTEDKKIHAAPDPLLEDCARFAETLDTTPAGSLSLIGRRHVRSNNSWLHNSKRLVKGPDRCTLMIHPIDAKERGLQDGDLASVVSRIGAVEIAIEITEDIMPGVVSIPHGWGHHREGVSWQTAADHAGVSLNDLTDPERFDRLTGNAVLNGTPVTVEPAQEIVAAE